jgi:hypothetical protein
MGILTMFFEGIWVPFDEILPIKKDYIASYYGATSMVEN